jgi:hypothetical protein
MNERIKELAKQANIEFTYDSTETPMRVFAECWEDELAKFAELIVKECLMLNAKELSAAAQFRMFDIYWDHFGIKE